MRDDVSASGSMLLRRLTIPVAIAVGATVVVAWYVTWASSDVTMMLLVPATVGSTDLALFFSLIVVMMVAMMLPSALPMILAYHGMTRLEAGRPTKRADALATVAFTIPYFAVWGAFGVGTLLALLALGILGPWSGLAVVLPGGVLIAAGLWQVTRAKEVCLAHCTSPAGFVLHHWRSGRLGAIVMGFRHSLYCIGCCWLFMIVLFVSGSMSLLWMGALSVVIFVEKLGVRTVLISRAIGVLLVVLGGLVATAGILSA